MQDTSSKQQTKQKYKTSHQQTGLPPHSALPIRGKTNKQTKSQHKFHPNHSAKLRRAETKRKKEFNLETWENKTSDKIRLKKIVMKRRENTTQMKEPTRNTEVQINEEEIGKLPKKNSE